MTASSRRSRAPIGSWPVLLLAAGLSACSIGQSGSALMREIHPPLAPSELDRPVPADALRDDLTLLLQTLDEVHPGAYERLPRETFVRSIDSLAAALDGPRTRRDFFLAVQPVVARLRDGHTSVQYPSGEESRLQRRGAAAFPLVVSLRGGHVVARNAAGGVAAGDTLRAIDGLAGRVWAGRVLGLVSGESAAQQEAFAESDFALYHALLDPDGGPFGVTVGTVTYRLDGVTLDSVRAARRALGGGGRRSYATRPDGVGVLTVPTFGVALDRFAAFLDGAVAQARADSARALVVDVRRNPGGDSRNVEALVDRLTAAPYRIASRTEHRRSRQYGRYWPKKFIGSRVVRGLLHVVPVHRLHPASRRYYAARIGTDVVTDIPLHEPDLGLARFPGPVAVLTSAYSASGAVVLAATVQDHGLGVVVGEETGQWATMHGEPYYFELPNARLLVGVSTYRIVRPSGSEAPGGVAPDVEVETGDALDAAVAALLSE